MLGLNVTNMTFQHTAARRRLDCIWARDSLSLLFQHTAARRRLAGSMNLVLPTGEFQHTAARRRLGFFGCCHDQSNQSFNTQPPEGGWLKPGKGLATLSRFNTQPPEGGWQT